jgi:hypothetical protein
MQSFEAYKIFLAVKRHFSYGSTYDYHKYGGRLNVKASSFEARSDRYFYEKLARKRDVLSFCVANCSANPKCWVGDLFNDQAEEEYNRFMRVTESITYTLGREMGRYASGFDKLFKFEDGNHPVILNAYLAGQLSPEVLCVIDQLVGFTKHWEKYSWDPTVKQSIHRIQRLRGFVEYDREKVVLTLKKLFLQEAS